MSFATVRTLCARAAVLALSAPLLVAGSVPAASFGHAMVPAVESESQADFYTDVLADATTLPPLPGCVKTVPVGCFRAHTIRVAYGILPVPNQVVAVQGPTFRVL